MRLYIYIYINGVLVVLVALIGDLLTLLVATPHSAPRCSSTLSPRRAAALCSPRRAGDMPGSRSCRCTAERPAMTDLLYDCRAARSAVRSYGEP